MYHFWSNSLLQHSPSSSTRSSSSIAMVKYHSRLHHMEENTSFYYDIRMAIVWFALCCGNHFMSDLYSRLFISGFSNRLSSEQQRSWRNRSTSTMHATTMSALFCVYWLNVYDSTATGRGIINFEYMSMFIMSGYLVYDSIYEISNFMFQLLDTTPVVNVLTKKDQSYGKSKNTTTKEIKKSTAWRINYTSVTILAHHLFGLMAHIAIMKFKCGLAARYLMFIYGAEMSTPLLNMCWMLMSMNLKQTKLYTYAGSSLLVTFLWRNFIGLAVIYSLTVDAGLWKGSTLNGRQYHKDEMLYLLLYGITLVFVFLNATWTYKLAKSAFSDCG